MKQILSDELELVFATEIATQAHLNQVDKAGVDYIKHPIAVASFCNSIKAKTIAMLHDVLEDTKITKEDLLLKGISEEVIDAVVCLTHLPNETIEIYFKRIASNMLATEVKFADMKHNSDIERLSNKFNKNEAEKTQYKYLKRTELLKSIILSKQNQESK